MSVNEKQGVGLPSQSVENSLQDPSHRSYIWAYSSWAHISHFLAMTSRKGTGILPVCKPIAPSVEVQLPHHGLCRIGAVSICGQVNVRRRVDLIDSRRDASQQT